MLFAIIFYSITACFSLMSMEKQEQPCIIITTSDQQKISIAPNIALKIPLIHHLIDHETVSDIIFPTKANITKKVFTRISKSVTNASNLEDISTITDLEEKLNHLDIYQENINKVHLQRSRQLMRNKNSTIHKRQKLNTQEDEKKKLLHAISLLSSKLQKEQGENDEPIKKRLADAREQYHKLGTKEDIDQRYNQLLHEEYLVDRDMQKECENHTMNIKVIEQKRKNIQNVVTAINNDINKFSVTMPKSFQETIALYKALNYLLLPKETAQAVLRHACLGCPITESDLEKAKNISITPLAMNTFNSYCDYTSKPSLSILEAEDVIDIVFGPDGKTLASIGHDATITLWNPSTGKLITTLNEHTSRVNDISFSPDGKIIASASNDTTIKLWNPSTGELITTLHGHINPIRLITFSFDGKTLASICYHDATIKLWNPSTGKLITTLNGHINPIRLITFSPDGKTLASIGHDATIKLWNPSTRELIATLHGHTTWVNHVTFSPDGKTLASASDDKTIKLWAPSTGDLITTLNGHTVDHVTFSPDGKILASIDTLGIKFWNLSTGELITTLKEQATCVGKEQATCVGKIIFSPDGATLAGVGIWHPLFLYSFNKLNLSFQELLRKRYEEQICYKQSK